MFRHTFDSLAVADGSELDAVIEAKKNALEAQHGVTLDITGVAVGPDAAVTVSWTVRPIRSQQH